MVTFDTSEPQQVALADGTQIYIPAGAMPVNGMVTLRIIPVATLPRQLHANLLKYGYAFLATDQDGQPIKEHFNQDVVIRFSYDARDLLQSRLREEWLKPAYYSTTTDEWTFPDSYSVDTSTHTVTMEIDHFTDFALTADSLYNIYLPMVKR